MSYTRGPRAHSCADTNAITEAVSARLGYSPFALVSERVIDVRVSRDEGVWWAHLELFEAGELRGQRTLRSDDPGCDALMDALVLTLSIAIDPMRALLGEPAPVPTPAADDPIEPGDPQGSPSPSRDEDEDEDEPAPSAERVEARTRPRALVDDYAFLLPEISGGVFGGVGATPGAFLGVSVGAAVRSGPLSFHLEARADPPSTTPLPEGGAVGGALLSAAFLPCYRLYAGDFVRGNHPAWVSGCGVAHGGVLFASSSGLVAPELAVSPWASFGGRVALDASVNPRAAIRLSAEMSVPVTHVRLVDSVSGDVLWSSPWVTGALALHLVWFFS
jgi:hypothetical protein